MPRPLHASERAISVCKNQNDHLPSLCGYEQVCQFAERHFNVRVTPRYVREATERRALASSLIARRCHYAPADVESWLLSLRREVTGAA